MVATGRRTDGGVTNIQLCLPDCSSSPRASGERIEERGCAVREGAPSGGALSGRGPLSFFLSPLARGEDKHSAVSPRLSSLTRRQAALARGEDKHSAVSPRLSSSTRRQAALARGEDKHSAVS